eukprot:2290671-Prymnesium_polylepis.2
MLDALQAHLQAKGGKDQCKDGKADTNHDDYNVVGRAESKEACCELGRAGGICRNVVVQTDDEPAHENHDSYNLHACCQIEIHHALIRLGDQ